MSAVRKILPIGIPTTSPQSYVSFLYALNLREHLEDTGGWHFRDYWFHLRGVSDRTPPIAGKGGIINTTPWLGERGVRDMGAVLMRHGITADASPVYVANHYRAIADLVFEDLIVGDEPMTATVREINSWLHTEAEIDTLRAEYILPLRDALDAAGRSVFDLWQKTLIWD